MGRKVNIRSGGVTAARAEALAKRFLAGEATWEDLLASDALMVYSGDFKRHVASLCNVDPESGGPLSEPETKKEPPKADPKPDPEPESEETEEEETETETSRDIELDEAEEAANGADGPEEETEEDTEAEADPETGDETEEETEEENVADEADESEPLAWDMCAWCAQGPATVCIDVSISQGGDRRLMRVDHVCDECAGAYWEAIRNAQFSRMSPDPEPDEEEEK